MKTKREMFKEHPEQFMLKCGVCGKMFLPNSYEQYDNLVKKAKKYHRIFYCSQECKKVKKGTIKYHCDNCNKEFDVKKYDQEHRKQHFCSKECYVEYRKKNKKSDANRTSYCLNCKNEFIVKKSDYGKFCSKECEMEYKRKLIDEKIEKGILVSHKVLKSYLIRHHNKCMNEKCKWNWDGDDNPVLELHHIDGNHENNTLENCILLCPNCHSLTENYKFKNSHKSTRGYRKKYYKND